MMDCTRSSLKVCLENLHTCGRIFRQNLVPVPPRYLDIAIKRPLHGDWRIFCLLIHCIIGSYFVYLSIKNSIIFLPWHTNPRIPMSM
ncbi:hypothetical protein CS546_01110 [Porphyromonas gingivalis]|nr:hypothetical protein CS546_01110 [Porphyromonas gingivalis]ATR96910.1 hypothetical protein CS548_07480 [Porphyromonas gingivalis]